MKMFNRSLAARMVLVMGVLLFLFSLFIGITGIRGMTNALLGEVMEDADQILDMATLEIDTVGMDTIIERKAEPAEYDKLKESLDRICRFGKADRIYLMKPDTGDYRHMTILLSSTGKEKAEDSYTIGQEVEINSTEFRLIVRGICQGAKVSRYVISGYNPATGDAANVVVMTPYTDTEEKVSAILCCELSLSNVTIIRSNYTRKMIKLLILTASIILFGAWLYLDQALFTPIRSMADEATRFARENTPKGNKLPGTILNEDEIGILADSIIQMEDQIQVYIDDLTRTTAEKERISTELSVAARIQDSILPKTYPAFPNRTEFDIIGSMNPAKEVGGDFYDYFMIDENHLGLAIADVSGKGVPAALFMMASRIILKNQAMINLSPGQVLYLVNNTICETNKEFMFVTVWLGILDLSTGLLKAANAGHEFPALKKAGGDFELIKDPHGMAIGVFEDNTYDEYEVLLEPGEKLFVYTDGIPEAIDPDENMYGMDRMIEALNIDAGAPVPTLIRNVWDSVNSFAGNLDQFDDLTMLCLEYHGKSGSTDSQRKGEEDDVDS